jgi:hypothetical protein
MSFEAALENNEGGMVAGEAIQAGDEEDVVFASLGTGIRSRSTGLCSQENSAAYWTPSDALSVSRRPRG